MGRPKLISVDTSLLRVPQYRCEFEGCGKYFSKLSRLKYHQNTHLEEKPYKCSYDGCSSSYYRPNHLKRHVESMHKPAATPKDHRCPREGCGAAFDSESSLYFHTKRKHSTPAYQCSFCDKRFSKKWKIKEHEAGHTGAFPFKCDFEGCTEEFKDNKKFRSHKREHEKKKTKDVALTCPVDSCFQTFQRWSELVSHKKLCHPLGTQCKICNKTFTQRNLKVHLPIHEEQRQTFPCTVDGCPRFYFHQKNVNHHIKVKHEGNGFNCDLCDRKLSTKQKLLHHMDIIHSRNPTSPKKRKKTSLLSKLTSMTDDDWIPIKTGPARFVRQKYNFIKFPDSIRIEDVTDTSQPVKNVQPCETLSSEISNTCKNFAESVGGIAA